MAVFIDFKDKMLNLCHLDNVYTEEIEKDIKITDDITMLDKVHNEIETPLEKEYYAVCKMVNGVKLMEKYDTKEDAEKRVVKIKAKMNILN